MNIFFLIFIIVPIVEMVILIEVGSIIGAGYTIGLVLLTAMIGVNLLKKQGLSALTRANEKMSRGQMPVKEMGEGMMLAMAGALLLTPGFVTDTVGFILLTPGLRQKIATYVARLVVNSSNTSVHYTQFSEFNSRPDNMRGDQSQNQHTSSSESYGSSSSKATYGDYRKPLQDNEIVEAEFEEIDQAGDKNNSKKD